MSVATTKIGSLMNNTDYGYAARELFMQFVARIAQEIPTATLAMFSTLKYVNASNFEKFRNGWSAKYLDGFIVHSKSFDGLKGNFPIGFLVWQTNQNKQHVIDKISTEIIDRKANAIGEKVFYNIPNNKFLIAWILRLKKNNVDVIPLINTVTPTGKIDQLRHTKWSNDAIAHFVCDGNDLQQSVQGTLLLSSVSAIGHKGAFYVTGENLWQVAIVFAVRRLIKPTWINDRDQFLQPRCELPDEFKNDCLIWMLFSGSNLTASANDLEWNNQKWSIVNYFIPYCESEVNATDRFESDFMVQYLADKTFSAESIAVLDAGRELWRAYFSHTDVRSVRDEYKLNRADVGWYQIRNALKKRNESGDAAYIDFSIFELAYATLSDKLRPLVYEYGFLR